MYIATIKDILHFSSLMSNVSKSSDTLEKYFRLKIYDHIQDDSLQ